MKYFFAFLIISFLFLQTKQNFLTIPSLKVKEYIQIDPSKDLFCEMVRELYVESEWYLSKISNIETVEGIEITKMFKYLFKAIYDNTAEASRAHMSDYEALSRKTLFSLKRSWGIINPNIDKDWEELIMMFIPFVAKNLNSQGQTCLRPSQLSMILYTLYQANIVTEQNRSKTLQIFLDSLKNNFDYEQALDSIIDEMFEKRTELQDVYEIFVQQNQSLILQKKEIIKQSLQSRIDVVKQCSSVQQFLENELNKYQHQKQFLIDSINQHRTNVFDRILFLVTNKNADRLIEEQTSINQKDLVKNSPLYDSLKKDSLDIQDPNYDMEDEDWFQQTLNYILVQKFKMDKSNKNKKKDDMEIINEEKGKVNTMILNSIDAHFRLRYKISKHKLQEIKNTVSKLKMFKQSIKNQNQNVTWEEMLDDKSIKKQTFLKYILQGYLENDNIQKQIFPDFASDIRPLTENIKVKFHISVDFTEWLFHYLVKEVYEKQFVKNNIEIDQIKEEFKQMMVSNFETVNSDNYYKDYIYFFLIYNYNVIAENLPLSFIIDFSKRIQDNNQLEADLKQFAHFYFDFMKISIGIEDNQMMLSEDQSYILERIRKKLGYTFSAVGLAGLLGFEVFFSWASGLAFGSFNALIPKTQIIQAINDTEFMRNAKENFKHVKSYITGQRLNDWQAEIVQKYENMDFMSATNINLLTKTDLNLRYRLLKLNQDNFHSQDSLFLWKNLKPVVNIKKLLVL